MWIFFSNNIKCNQVNDTIDNELKFDRINSLANYTVKDELHTVNIILRGGKNSRQTLNSGLTCLSYSISTNIMIKHKHIYPYKPKLRDKKAKYIMEACPYKTTHDVKVIFSMPYIFSINIIIHQFHV